MKLASGNYLDESGVLDEENQIVLDLTDMLF